MATEPSQNKGTTIDNPTAALRWHYWAIAAVALVLAVVVASLSASAPPRQVILRAFSVLVGGGVSLANLAFLRWVVALTISGGGTKGGALVAGGLKLLLLLALIYALFTLGWASPLHFVVGVASLPIGIVLAQLGGPRNGSKGE